jgi:hypothetical protein
MTVLTAEKILLHSRVRLWPMVSHFEQATRWVDSVKKIEPVGGQAAPIGSVWRVYLDWYGSERMIDFEITEWLEGERLGLRPLNMPAVESEAVLYQIIFNLKALAEHRTQVTIQCEYEPRHRFAKIKNLMFLRRHYLRRLKANLAAFEHFSDAQATLPPNH